MVRERGYAMRVLNLVIALLLPVLLSTPVLPVAYASEDITSLKNEVTETEYTISQSSEEMFAVLSELEVSPNLNEAELQGASSYAASSYSAGLGAVSTLGGADRYETAALQARYAFPNGCSSVILVGSDAWADALTAASLAGALNCPILFCGSYVPDATLAAIKDLGIKNFTLIGGPGGIPFSVERNLKNTINDAVVNRIYGADRYETQAAVYDYGEAQGYWSSDLLIVASGTNFPDALSASSLAFAHKAPVVLLDSTAYYPDEQFASLEAQKAAGTASYNHVAVLGGTGVSSNRALDYAQSLTSTGVGAVRLGGASRYDTSAAIAQWCVDQGYLNWDGAAFVSAALPYDALAGSVVQGRDSAVLLLVNSPTCITVEAAAVSNAVTSSLKFFGGNGSISPSLKADIQIKLGFMQNVNRWYCNVSLTKMAQMEVEANKTLQGYSYNQIMEYLDPSNFAYGSSGFYQFAKLGQGYSGKLTASQLNSFVTSTSSGKRGKLAGMGAAFIDAARTYGINEVYLLSHAILESAWGTSTLASGYYYDGNTAIGGKYYPAGTYYNFYGIGAYDSSPLSGGRAMAIKEGWNSPEKAILGAAKWIKDGYVGNSYGQDTLYKMRWNVSQVASGISPWKQYASDRMWAASISRVMASCFSHNGVGVSASGLVFDYPFYNA